MAVEMDVELRQPAGSTSVWRWFPTPDRRLLLLSIALQLVLGLLLGHANDMRIFMTTGYLAATGQNPYVPRDLMHVFHHLYFDVHSTIGYPPPWPIVLGGTYRVVYAVAPSLLLYNLAIKLPVIAANVGLAYLTAAILLNLGSPAALARKAWVFLLLNPFLIYFTAAWGQIDGVAALAGLAALVLLWRAQATADAEGGTGGRRALDPGTVRRELGSALLLALAACIKPVALPLLFAALVWLARRSLWRAARYCAGFLAGVVLFYLVPFAVFGWSLAPALRKWNAVLAMSGTMSYMSVLRVLRDPFPLPGHWWLLGLLWVPALIVATVVSLRRRDDGVDGLFATGAALVLVFLLTRTWTSATNVVVLLPLVLMLTLRGRLDRRALTVVWVLPLVFSIFGWTELQLLWPAWPGLLQRALAVPPHFQTASVLARAALVIVWQVAGWWIVIACLRRTTESPSAVARSEGVGPVPQEGATSAPREGAASVAREGAASAAHKGLVAP